MPTISIFARNFTCAGGLCPQLSITSSAPSFSTAVTRGHTPALALRSRCHRISQAFQLTACADLQWLQRNVRYRSIRHSPRLTPRSLSHTSMRISGRKQKPSTGARYLSIRAMPLHTFNSLGFF
jgi:hypothetical protein